MVAKKNIIEGAAHGSSGASELKTRKAWILTSAKKAKSTLSLVGAIFFGSCGLADGVPDFVTLSNSVCQLTLATYQGTTLKETSYTTTFANLRMRLLREKVAVRYFPATQYVGVPNLGLTLSSPSTASANYTQRPVSCVYDGVTYSFVWRYFDDLTSLYLAFQSAMRAGYESPIIEHQATGSDGSRYMNVCLGDFVFDVLTGTNTAYRSIVVNSLVSINSNVQTLYGDMIEIGASIDGIGSSLDTLSGKFSAANFQALQPFSQTVEGAVQSELIDPYQAQDLLDRYDSLSGNLADQESFASSVRDTFSALRSLAAIASNSNLAERAGRGLNSGLQDSIEGGFSASAHIQGATTNLLQKMTNVTDQIKKDLEAWRTDATNRLEQQWSGIRAVETNTHDTASGVAQIVEHGVKINSPVEVVLGTDFLGVELKVGDIAELIQGFADGSDAAMQRWLDEWEMFKDDQLPYMARFSAFVRDNTNLLSSIEKRLDFGFTNTLDATYSFLTNGLERAISNGVAGIGLNLTNELWDYYFDRFQKANEFKDDDGQLFSSIDNQRRIVFGNGFDDSEYKKLDWFSRVELLLYQIGYASTNSTESIEASDLEGEFDDVSDEIQTAASAFEGAARRVVGVFSLVGRFAQAIKNAFADIAAPSTDGILLLEGGSWIFEEPLYLRVPVLIQNALRLVFQCVWYLSAFVIGWRLVSFAWGRVASLVRWLWSLIDV